MSEVGRFSQDTSVIMAMMVEVAPQRMLTNRPTVALTSDRAIWPVARSPSRAMEPRTEITRPKDVTMLNLACYELVCATLCRRCLEKRLNRRSAELIKSATFRRDFILGGVGRLTLIDGCMENRRFWRCALAPMRFRLTFDSP